MVMVCTTSKCRNVEMLEFNNKVGKVLYWDSKKKRYSVAIHMGDQGIDCTMMIYPANLRRLHNGYRTTVNE